LTRYLRPYTGALDSWHAPLTSVSCEREREIGEQKTAVAFIPCPLQTLNFPMK